jgi:hypothetical protein
LGFHYLCGIHLLRRISALLAELWHYVRYFVGIVLTIVIGRQAIISLNKYLEKQRLTETMPEAKRR